MSKFASFAEYPKCSLAGAEAALLTAWASLSRYHDNLVLVGGLAVKYLTKPGAGLLPGPVTMDVDLGVTLATEGGQYGTIGPLLVLKLNAFDDRQQPKDAHDVMLGVTRFVEGPEAAIASFHSEATASNRGFARASVALRKHFLEIGQSGPVRCAAFVLEGQAGMDDFQSRQRQIPDKEEALARDWNAHIHGLKATFDRVLRELDEVQSAKDNLNRHFAKVAVSNLRSVRM